MITTSFLGCINKNSKRSFWEIVRVYSDKICKSGNVALTMNQKHAPRLGNRGGLLKAKVARTWSVKRWVARGNKTTKFHHSFSGWWGPQHFQCSADSVVSKKSCERRITSNKWWSLVFVQACNTKTLWANSTYSTGRVTYQ